MIDILDGMEDFDTKKARILVSGAVAVIDNIRKIIIMTEELIVVDYGKGQVSLNGNKMIVQYISNGRMYIRGSFNSIEFTGDK